MGAVRWGRWTIRIECFRMQGQILTSGVENAYE
jgi:hypothetical protein